MSGSSQQLDQVRGAPTAPDQRRGDRPRGRLIYRHTALVRAKHWINVVFLTILLMSSLQSSTPICFTRKNLEFNRKSPLRRRRQDTDVSCLTSAFGSKAGHAVRYWRCPLLTRADMGSTRS